MKASLILLTLLLKINTFADIGPSGYKVFKGKSCGGFPRVALESAPGTCIGMVADSDMGFSKPRMAIEVNDGYFISDLKSWAPNQGSLFFLKKSEQGLIPAIVFKNLDRPHTVVKGPDGLVYVGEAGQIFRFDPKSPEASKEVIVKGLPTTGSHPLSYFIFDSNGDLILNIGAPSDQCLTDKNDPQYPCPAMKGSTPQAAVYRVQFDKKGQVISNTPIAKGLRNSMALLENPLTGELLQFENNMDFSKEDTPYEEINIIQEGKHYGWPYCYEMGKLNKKYKRSFFNRKVPKISCSKYTSPIALLPPHSAPLGVLFYNEENIPSLTGKILVSLHGYRKNGQRIISLDPTRLNDSKDEVISNWKEVEGLHPKGAPVGLSVSLDGNILVVDDKNKNVLIVAASDEELSNGEVIQIETPIELTKSQKKIMSQLEKEVLNKFNCTSCHSLPKKDPATLIKSLNKLRWINPGNAESSLIIKRMKGLQGERQMPPQGRKVPKDLIESFEAFINSI